MNEVPSVSVATGKVMALSPTNNSFMLPDETWYTLTEGEVMSKLKKGDTVKIMFKMVGTKRAVVELNVTEPAKAVFGGYGTHKSGNWAEDMVSFEDLLNNAHKDGTLESIHTEMIQVDWDKHRALFRATVTMQSGRLGDGKPISKIFQAYGDATDENIQSGTIKPHFIRMAETRAIARALRWATNNAETAEEEK